jgi:hypothetical protein
MSILRYRTIGGQLTMSILEPEQLIEQLGGEIRMLRLRRAEAARLAGWLLVVVFVLLLIAIVGWVKALGWL